MEPLSEMPRSVQPVHEDPPSMLMTSAMAGDVLHASTATRAAATAARRPPTRRPKGVERHRETNRLRMIMMLPASMGKKERREKRGDGNQRGAKGSRRPSGRPSRKNSNAHGVPNAPRNFQKSDGRC